MEERRILFFFPELRDTTQHGTNMVTDCALNGARKLKFVYKDREKCVYKFQTLTI